MLAVANVRTAVCTVCDDSHVMALGEGSANCTHCPIPCQKCRAGGIGAYCEQTPCACICHDPNAPVEAITFVSAKPSVQLPTWRYFLHNGERVIAATTSERASKFARWLLSPECR